MPAALCAGVAMITCMLLAAGLQGKRVTTGWEQTPFEFETIYLSTYSRSADIFKGTSPHPLRRFPLALRHDTHAACHDRPFFNCESVR